MGQNWTPEKGFLDENCVRPEMGPFDGIQFSIDGQFEMIPQMFNDGIGVGELAAIQFDEWDLAFCGGLFEFIANILFGE